MANLRLTGTPGTDFYRYLGHQVLDQMGETQTNRWVIDQVMELDAPELFDKARKRIEELFDSGHHSATKKAKNKPHQRPVAAVLSQSSFST